MMVSNPFARPPYPRLIYLSQMSTADVNLSGSVYTRHVPVINSQLHFITGDIYMSHHRGAKIFQVYIKGKIWIER